MRSIKLAELYPGQIGFYGGQLLYWTGTHWVDDHGLRVDPPVCRCVEHPWTMNHATGILTCDACGERVDRFKETPVHHGQGASMGTKQGNAQQAQVTSVEGNTMDLERRIKYDDLSGQWKVIFNGRVVKTDKPFKSSSEAYQYMEDLRTKKTEPKYE